MAEQSGRARAQDALDALRDEAAMLKEQAQRTIWAANHAQAAFDREWPEETPAEVPVNLPPTYCPDQTPVDEGRHAVAVDLYRRRAS